MRRNSLGNFKPIKHSIVADKPTSTPPTWTARFCNWFKPYHLATRLNDVATVACIFDTAVITLSACSKTITAFFYNGIPSPVEGMLYLGPSLLPFIPNLLTCRYVPKHTLTPEDSEEIMAAHFLEALKAEQVKYSLEFEEKVLQHEMMLHRVFAERKAHKQHDTFNFCDNFSNSAYLLLRAVSGVLTVIEAYKYVTDDKDSTLEQVNTWISVISNMVYMGYILSGKLPQRCRKRLHLTSESAFDTEELRIEKNLPASISLTPQTFFSGSSECADHTSALAVPLLSQQFV